MYVNCLLIIFIMAIDLNEDYADVEEMHEKMRDVTDLEKTKK